MYEFKAWWSLGFPFGKLDRTQCWHRGYYYPLIHVWGNQWMPRIWKTGENAEQGLLFCVCRPVMSVLVLPLGFFAVSDFQRLKENILHPFVECRQCQRSLPGNPKVSMLLIEGSVCWRMCSLYFVFSSHPVSLAVKMAQPPWSALPAPSSFFLWPLLCVCVFPYFFASLFFVYGFSFYFITVHILKFICQILKWIVSSKTLIHIIHQNLLFPLFPCFYQNVRSHSFGTKMVELSLELLVSFSLVRLLNQHDLLIATARVSRISFKLDHVPA